MVVPAEGERMLAMSKIVLPYEPDYVGHREAEKRRQETKEWLRRRERELAERSPSIVPERAPRPTRSAEQTRRRAPEDGILKSCRIGRARAFATV
jgi:hypothetical protein